MPPLPAATYGSRMAQPTLTVISIVVADMPSALAFYRACGLQIDPAGDTEAHAGAAPVNGLTVMFDTHEVMRSIDPDWVPGTGGHRMALAFDCGDPAGVDAQYETLMAAGHASVHAPFDAPWGQRYATVRDPDGNPVDFFAALA